MAPRHHTGFTKVELLVGLAVVGILGLLLFPNLTGSTCGQGGLVHTLSNMKQLHLATQAMALDRTTAGDTNVGWPGDIGGTFSNWTTVLVQSNYLSQSDLCKLLSAPGIQVPTNSIPLTNNTALLVYATSTNSARDAVFLSTANFTNTPTGGALNSSAKPYGKKGFVVYRMAGDGAILLPKQVGQTNVIGSYVPLCR